MLQAGKRKVLQCMENIRTNSAMRKIGIMICIGIISLIGTIAFILVFPFEKVICLENSSTYNRKWTIIPYQGKWEQELVVGENFDSIEIMLATYCQEYDTGVLNIKFSEKDSGTVLCHATAPASSIRDCDFLHIDLGKVKVKEDTVMIMELWMEEFADHSLALLCTEELDSLIIKLLYRNKNIGFEKILTAFFIVLCCECTAALFLYKAVQIVKQRKFINLFRKGKILKSIALMCLTVWLILFLNSLLTLGTVKREYYICFFIITFILLILIIAITRRTEIFVASVIVLLGSYLSVAFPLGEISWDDHIHYTRALSVTHIYTENASAAEMWYQTPFIDNVQDINEVSNNKKELNLLYQEEIDKRPIDDSLNWYNQLCYIPAALFMFFGRLLCMPAHSLYYMGRLGSVFLYAVLIYCAIRRLKSGKMILAIIALIPTNLFLVASYSYDPWVTGFMIYGISCVISELQQPEKKMSIRDVAVMLGAFLFMGSAKAIYFPMAFLAFFIKKNKFNSIGEYRKYCISVGIIILLLVLSFAVPMLVKPESLTDVRGGGDVNSVEQIKFILSHPFSYGKILFNFMKDYMSLAYTGGYMTSFAYLGGGSKLEIILVLLGIVAVTDKNKSDSYVSYWYKYGTILLACVTASLIATALYIAFTPVRAEYIAGCQSRYLMPLLFPVLCIAGSRKIVNNINKTYYALSVYGVILYILGNSFWKGCIMLYQK